MKIEVETEVAAPPDVVYATVTDVVRWPDFMRGVERVEILTPDPLAAGTMFRETRTMFGRSATEEMTVAVLDPPRRFDLTAENHGTRYHIAHEVSAAGDGSRLRLSFEGTPVTLAAKIGSVVALLFKGAVMKQLRSDLADVKAEAERRARG
jgi:carbon monoxide dehydrogenase subunit G